MAKDYLSMQQVCEALSMSEEQVKALVSQGKLHEVRDAGKVFFKKAEVVDVAGKEGSSVVDLQATDEAAPAELDLDDSETFASALSSLADSSATLGAIDESPIPDEPPPLEPAAEGSSGDFGSGPALSDEDKTPEIKPAAEPQPAELTAEDVPEELPAAPKESTEQSELSSEIGLLPVDEGGSSTDATAATKQQPTAEVPDLGLSGSSIISLEPGGDSSVSGSPVAKEGTKFSKAGINVFEDEDLGIESDPMGETQISSGVEDFDAVGSGSGLLDMTQESDDTSLGPELLDVISPSDAAETETEAEAIEAVDGETVTDDASPVAMMEEEPVAMEEAPAAAKAAAKRVAVAEMAGATPLNVCMLIGLVGLATLGLATASMIQGVWPEKVLGIVSSGMIHYAVFGGLALITIVTGVLSILADRGK